MRYTTAKLHSDSKPALLILQATRASNQHFSLPGGRIAEPFLLNLAWDAISSGSETVLRNVFYPSGYALLDQCSCN